MTETLSRIIEPYFSGLINASFVLICLVVPVIFAGKSDRFLHTMARTWLLLFCWFAFMSFVIAPMVYDDPDMREVVPDGPAVAAALIVGWLPSSVISIIALVIAKVIDRFFPTWVIKVKPTDAKIENPPINEWHDL